MDWDSAEISSIIDRALAEDIGSGDITTLTLFPSPPSISAIFLAKEDGVLAGLPLVQRIFNRLDPKVVIDAERADGDLLHDGQTICHIKGNAAALLSGERIALNFLQHLSGIATQTSIYAAAAAPLRIAVLDTRKTTPLLRSLEKYAVTVGGGTNHRAGLFDAVLVKDNHLKLQPDFIKILAAFKSKGYPVEKVEIEVTDLEMLKRAMAAGACSFLLDNMKPSLIRRCVKIKHNNAYFEVSGGITPENFSAYLIRGVDAISIGGLTHSAKSLDISMEINV